MEGERDKFVERDRVCKKSCIFVFSPFGTAYTNETIHITYNKHFMPFVPILWETGKSGRYEHNTRAGVCNPKGGALYLVEEDAHLL